MKALAEKPANYVEQPKFDRNSNGPRKFNDRNGRGGGKF
jgi:hypothetical protein